MKFSRHSSALAVFAFVCAAVASLGIHGDPFGGNKQRLGSVFGESTGTLTPQPQPPFPGLVGPGVFHLDIPREGEGVGDVVLSLAGTSILTLIDAVADPNTRHVTGLITAMFPVIGGQIEFTVKPLNASGRMKLKGSATVILDPFFAAEFGLPPIIPYRLSGSKLPNKTGSTLTPTSTPTPTP